MVFLNRGHFTVGRKDRPCKYCKKTIKGKTEYYKVERPEEGEEREPVTPPGDYCNQSCSFEARQINLARIIEKEKQTVTS